MKRFKQILSNQKFIFWFITISLIVTNVMMFFTESTSLLTRVVQIVLPFAIYWFVMTLGKKPGKMFWWLFIVAFYDAFEIVLLKLYGETPLAVDMLLNVTTTNVNEVNELLFNLLPAVLFAVILYMACIILSIVSIRKKEPLDANYRRHNRKRALVLLAVADRLCSLAKGDITPSALQRLVYYAQGIGFYPRIICDSRSSAEFHDAVGFLVGILLEAGPVLRDLNVGDPRIVAAYDLHAEPGRDGLDLSDLMSVLRRRDDDVFAQLHCLCTSLQKFTVSIPYFPHYPHIFPLFVVLYTCMHKSYTGSEVSEPKPDPRD